MEPSDLLIRKLIVEIIGLNYMSLFYKVILVCVLVCISLSTIANEMMESTNLDINIDYSNEPFYSEIWFWVLIAVFFLLLLVLLIRGGRKSSDCCKVKESNAA